MNDDEIGKVFGVVAVQGDLSLIIGENYLVQFKDVILGKILKCIRKS